MSRLSVILQESVERNREATPTTIIRLLREQMDAEPRRRSLKERLGFKAMGCCGGAWAFGSTTISVTDDDYEEEDHRLQLQGRAEASMTHSSQNQPESASDPVCVDPAPVSSGMNLAAALAAERHFRSTHELEGEAGNGAASQGPTSPGTPLRVSLLRLLEETEGGDGEEEGGDGAKGSTDSVCCVCMGRKKGAAFIPCGHTFCRVCSRELWLNRGSCPLCNRSILEILDIF